MFSRGCWEILAPHPQQLSFTRRHGDWDIQSPAAQAVPERNVNGAWSYVASVRRSLQGVALTGV